MEKKYDLTIGMIVKNEEKNLEECIKALLPIKEDISCEIIITDTGSTDKTIEIAEKYADKVLHFDWCDDYASARNVGVKESQGAWFMYVDADEVFEDGVAEVVKFIKSADRDNYDSAILNQRSYFDETRDLYEDTKVRRLINFTSSNREFFSNIYEDIEINGKSSYLECSFAHYGYVGDKLQEKRNIKKDLIVKQYDKSPNDFRAIKFYLDTISMNECIVLKKEIYKLIDEVCEKDYSNVKHMEYIFLIFYKYICGYVRVNSYKGSIEHIEKFVQNKFVQNYKPKANLPTMDLYHYSAIAYYNLKDYEKAIEYFKKYQDMYKELEKTPDEYFALKHKYVHNNKNIYELSKSILISCYINLNDFENANKYLEEYEAYKYAEEQEDLLANYCLSVLVCGRKDLYEKVKSYFDENEIEYNANKFKHLLVCQLYFERDLSFLINNCSFGEIGVFFKLIFSIPQFQDVFTELLVNDITANNLREVRIYLQLAYWHLISQIPRLKQKNNLFMYKEDVEAVFNFYVETTMYYLNEVYEPVVFQKQNLELLSKSDGMCVILSKHLKDKTNNRVEYIKSLRNALVHNPEFKHIILNSISVIENEIKFYEESREKTEFEQLAEKIKKSITNLISQNQMEQAKIILQQYKSISPNDPDIEKFNKLMV